MTFDADLLREQRDDEQERDLHSFQRADRLRDEAPASDTDPLDGVRFERLVQMRGGDGHEREFKVDVEPVRNEWQATLSIRPIGGEGWEQYAAASAPQRIDVIQAIAHYMVAA